MHKIIETDNFNDGYKKLVNEVINKGSFVISRGAATLELVNYTIVLTNIEKCRLDFTRTEGYDRQKKYDDYAKNEIEWYESGCLVASHAPSKKWKNIANLDGVIQSNYGYIILKKKLPYSNPFITSYNNVLRLLKADKFSRQAILHYNLPENYDSDTQDIPCTVSVQVLIRDGKIHFIVFQRSSDLFYGLPYDILWHCHLMKKMILDLHSDEIQVEPGSISIVMGSVHIYNKDVDWFKSKFLMDRDYEADKK
ncbi:MAG: thymidylate synthase [Gammaproteobacteria bacterium]|nr:thymidylate synthase [Gammaproteobacteria bacterium]